MAPNRLRPRWLRVFSNHLIAASAIALPVVLLAACTAPSTGASGSGSGSGSGTGSGSITVGLAEAPDALDPTTASTFVGRTVFANMCQKLYDVNAQLALVPQLAAAMPAISDGGRVYTITLKPGITFNDGTPLTAAAVKTTLDWYLTNPQSERASELKGLTSVDVTGPLTVVLHLSKPFAPLTSVLADRAGMILSPNQLRKMGNNFAQHPVCVGPFEFSSRPSLDTIVLKKSPYYYGKAHVHLNTVTFTVITDPATMAADLQSGQIQVADWVAPQEVKAIENNSATTIEGQNSLGYEGLDINTGNVSGSLKSYGTASNPFATHPTLREAFELTLNRATLNKVAFDGLYTPGCSPIPPNSPWAVNVPCPAQNIPEAKALIKASGVQTPIHVSLMLENAPLELQIGSIIQSMAAQAGFDVTLQPLEFTTTLAKAAAGQFEMYQIGWSGRVDPDQNIFSDWYPGAGLNYTGADYPAINSLLVQARESTSTAERHVLYTRIVQLLHSERNIIYLWYDKYFLGLRKNVTGVQYFPDALVRLEYAQVS
jgi:peptide/nickel transport system substrate-binding protein